MNFDILDTQSFYPYIFGVDQTEAISVNFSLSGYNSLLTVNNLGSLFIFLVLDFGLGLLGFSILKSKKLNSKWQKIIGTKVENYFFNGMLNFFDQNYLSFTLSSLINLSSINYSNY